MDIYSVATLISLSEREVWKPKTQLESEELAHLSEVGYAKQIPGLDAYVITREGIEYATSNIFS